MKRRIRSSFMLVCMIAIATATAVAMFLYYQILKEQVFSDLKSYAHIITETDLAEISGEEGYNPWQDELRITLIDENGDVLYESYANKGEMDNHRERPEIDQAFSNGEGTAVRWSATALMHTFYYAAKQADGKVLRIGKDSNSIMDLVENSITMVCAVAVLIFFLCVWLSYYLTKKLVEPIEKLATNIVLVDESRVYEEIQPFVTTIKEQHVSILNNAHLRQEFTANISHELKTPLTAISGYAELIGNGMADAEDTRRFAGEIGQNSGRLLTLINDIIKLSELDSAEFEIDYEPIDLYETASSCIDSMRMQASKQDIIMSLVGETTMVRSNKGLMEELLYNLCSNAVRYNKRGGSVTVTVTTKSGRPYLSVEDTGIGISTEHQQRIFERFYRVDKSRSKSTGGTGLGLAIVKHIVVQHEAQMTLESVEGKGTRIEIIF